MPYFCLSGLKLSKVLRMRFENCSSHFCMLNQGDRHWVKYVCKLQIFLVQVLLDFLLEGMAMSFNLDLAIEVIFGLQSA